MVNLADLPNAADLSGTETLPMQQGPGAVKVTTDNLLKRAAGGSLTFSVNYSGLGASFDNSSVVAASAAGFDLRTVVSGTLTVGGSLFLAGTAWASGNIKPSEVFLSGQRGIFLGSANNQPIRFGVSSGGNTQSAPVIAEIGIGGMRLGFNPASPAARFAIGYIGGGSQYGMTMRPENDNTQAVQFANAAGASIGSISVTASATAYNTSSDYRLPWKAGHTALTGSGDFIDALNPRFFPVVGHAGFIAHEFAEASPSSVTGEKDALDGAGNPVYQQMDASSPDVMANIVAELQYLRRRVAALEAGS